MTRELIIKIKKYSIFFTFRIVFHLTPILNYRFEYPIQVSIRYAKKCSIQVDLLSANFRRRFDSRRRKQVHVANPHGYLFEIDWNRGGGLFQTVQKITFLNAFAIHFRILFSLISLRILEIQLKKNWPRALFFFSETSSKLFRPCKPVWIDDDAARNFCNLNV